MEVEITDAGPAADAAIIMALGFNLNQTNRFDSTGYVLATDTEEAFLNQEYDFNDSAGSFQLILKERYLVEIQLQNLPSESFQHIVNHQLSLDQLAELMVP